jgi:hypothetical protein
MMKNKTRIRFAVAAVAIAVSTAVLVFVLAQHVHQPRKPTPPALGPTIVSPPSSSGPAPIPTRPRFPAPFDRIDATNPIAVLTAACTTIFSYTPDIDGSQLAAARRAAPLIAPPGVDAGFATLAPIPGGQWREWAANHFRVAATVSVPPVGDNPDTPTIAARVVAVTLMTTAPDGNPVHGERPPPITVYATVARQVDGTWRLSRIDAA